MITKEKNKSNYINVKLLNKYRNVSEIFKNEKLNKYKKYLVTSKFKIENNFVYGLSNTEIYHFAVSIFNEYNKTNIFKNNNMNIIVSNTDIKESINKINNNYLQKKYLKEHLIIFSDLNNIIKRAVLVNQTLENKDRSFNKLWNYYLIWLIIDKSEFLFEFDVISKANGENHYRVQRLDKI